MLASSSFAFLAVSALYGLGVAISTVATSAYVTDVANRERIRASMGALFAIMDVGSSPGPLVVVVATAGYGAGFFVSLLMALAVQVVFAVSAAGSGRGAGG